MSFKQIQTTLRSERLPGLISCLKKRGTSRLFAWHAHALASTVDPQRYRLSIEEGCAYSDMSVLTFFCEERVLDELIGVIREHASTGHSGDGLIVVSDVERIVSVRTGEEGVLALA